MSDDPLVEMFAALRADIDVVPNAHDEPTAQLVEERLKGSPGDVS